MKRRMKNSDFQGKAITPSMKKHFKALDIKTERKYFAWCNARNFNADLNKDKGARDLEYERFLGEQKALKDNARIHHNADAFLHAVCMGEVAPKAIIRPEWQKIASLISKTPNDRPYRTGLSQFLILMNKKMKCTFEKAEIRGKQFFYIRAFINIYNYRCYWIRDLENWTPNTHNMHGQFCALISHLFEEYPAPEFMRSAWFRMDEVADNYRDWYLTVVSGKNIRSAELPFPFTKKLAHHFMHAPAFCSIEQAIKWGEIHALGGDENLAKAVIASRIGEAMSHKKFWDSVFQFFVENPMLDRAHIAPIIDFLYAQKFEVRECITAPGVVEHIHPPQPNLSMKGRTAESLLRQVERWHGNLAKSNDAQKYFFKKSGIPEFRQKTGEEKQDIRIIRELLSGAELIKEGREMRHCVASYARRCSLGHCSIWAMEYVSAKGSIEKHQTIEITKDKHIVQSRGKSNRLPTPSEFNIIKKWAQTAGLTIASYVSSR
ncbi:MAG: PcfJ domain-containing protein [Candidatus Thiodiazotropha sp. 6PLUC2]